MKKHAFYSAPLGLRTRVLGVPGVCAMPGAWLTVPPPPAAPPSTPTALAPRLLCGPPLPGTPRSPPREQQHPTVQRTTSPCILSWSSLVSHSGLGMAFMSPTPFSWHHSTLLALLWRGRGGRNGQARQHPLAIVWVLPLAPGTSGSGTPPHLIGGRVLSPTSWLRGLRRTQQAQQVCAPVQPAPSCAFQASVSTMASPSPCPGHLGGCDMAWGLATGAPHTLT